VFVVMPFVAIAVSPYRRSKEKLASRSIFLSEAQYSSFKRNLRNPPPQKPTARQVLCISPRSMFPRKLSGFGAADFNSGLRGSSGVQGAELSPPTSLCAFVPLCEILFAFIRVHSRFLFCAFCAFSWLFRIPSSLRAVTRNPASIVAFEGDAKIRLARKSSIRR
jgi:hypothetical protein